MFSYKRHSASFTLLEGWLFLRERLLSEITLLEYGGSAGTRNRNKCFLWEMPMPKAVLFRYVIIRIFISFSPSLSERKIREFPDFTK